MKHHLRFRQIHLDFHTAESIPEVAADFDAEVFAKTLSDAHVDSVTCFSRCHHGWLYYDSKKFPDYVHPNLKNRNLLKEQIEACHKYDIKVPVYTTVQWDAKIAREHRDWLVIGPDGGPFKQKEFAPGFYRNLCLNTPYVDFLKEQIEDVMECLGHLDGLFLDILNIQPCCCPRCVAEMQEMGMDASDETARYEFAQTVMDRFKRDMTKFIHSRQPDCPVFYNEGYIGTRHRGTLDAYTHLEIESLPGGSWGYDHFPVTAKYTRILGHDFMGMTGKFHLDWGDFGSLRNQPQLEYECFKSLAYGGKCSIGDQLHPGGMLVPAAYELVGSVYSQVEEKEPWCDNVIPMAEAGVLAPQEFCRAGTDFMTQDLVGAVKMLTQLQVQFNVIDTLEDFSKYRLLVLPDRVPCDEVLSQKIEAFIQNGGKVLASYKSGIQPDGTFADWMPVKEQEDAPFSPDFAVSQGILGQNLPETEFVMYQKGLKVTLREDAQELLKTNVPYNNRTWDHYCSHRHFPSTGHYGYPAAARNEHVIYFAHPVFGTYQQFGSRWLKTFVDNAIGALLGEKMIQWEGPSTLELALNRQEGEHRDVLHALHYIPERRSEELDLIEDRIPLYDIHVSLKTGKTNVRKVQMVPQCETLPFAIQEGRVEFKIPKIQGHQMVEIAYND